MKTIGFSILKKWAVLLSILVLQVTYSQNEGKVWYFGANAGLDFNQTPPTVLTNGQINTIEGTASLSDANGNLLFYTDGISIYDNTHQLMPNGQDGMGGHVSSAQSALIVPFPDQTNKYFVFTVTAYPESNQVYSIIDMTLNNGFGDVVEGFKALPFLDSTGEYIQAIASSDRSFWWILTHKAGTSDYYAFRLTSEGVDIENPVVSTVGNPSQPGGEIGFLKFNSLGNKLVRSAYISGYVEVSDFDSSSGFVSNSITFNSASAYGVEFSPNNKYLYVSSFTNQGVSQYNIEAATSASEIIASQYIYSTLFTGSLQVAPDGKIYGTRFGAMALDVIHEPNSPGVFAEFELNGQSIGSNLSQLGFPNIISTFVSTAQPTLNLLEVIEITSNSALLRVEIISNGGKEITNSGFNFGTSPENLNQTITVIAENGIIQTSLSNLEPETTYYFRGFATNLNGTTLTDVGSFMTLSDIDTIPPVAICFDNLTIELDEFGQAFINTEMIDNGSFDNDAIAEMYLNKTEFSCEDIGENTVTLTVVDIYGNTSTCESLVIFKDALAPEIFLELESNIQQTSSNQPYILPDFFAEEIAWAADNCTTIVNQLSQTPEPGSFLEAGLHLISLSATDYSGNTTILDFEIVVETVLGIDDFSEIMELKLFPNPTTDYFNITRDNLIFIENVSLFDLNGRLMKSILYNDVQEEISIDVSNLSAATYLVVIQVEGKSFVKKLIKR